MTTLPTEILDELGARDLLDTCTNLESLRARLARGPITVYCGFDPTADSLHVGHLLSLSVLRHWMRHGHDVIALVGGFTGMVGDPSGKSQERTLLDLVTLDANRSALTAQVERLLGAGDGRPRIVDNRSWFADMTALEFLRDVGKLVPVSDMLERESVRSRLGGQGLSFTEFSYQILQAHDFAHLRKTEGCELQVGGTDQYGNITAGTDMIRRRDLGSAWGLVWPLLTKADGTKFGKTESGTVWLAGDRTSPFAFHQYWLNVADTEVETLLAKFTLLDGDELAAVMMSHARDPALRIAQRRVADEVTAWVHGPEAVETARATAEALFSGRLGPEHIELVRDTIPTYEVGATHLSEIPLERLARDSGLCESIGEARRLIKNGGLYVDGRRMAEGDKSVDGFAGHVLLRKGSRTHALVVVTA
ncbi:MAG: tyrosine--tRNA ligase [Solirubrobacteraceae bacterium]